VHVDDSNRLQPGTGHMDFGAVLGALHALGYDGWLALECRLRGTPEIALPAAARFLAQHLDALGNGEASSRPEDLFAGHDDARAVYDEVRSLVDRLGPVETHVSRSQVAFRRKRGFAYIWLPGRYLSHPRSDVVLSIVLGRHDDSPRFAEVAHPAPSHWMHHLEIHSVHDIDGEVAEWLREAADHAG
jgi:hypothetical protein